MELLDLPPEVLLRLLSTLALQDLARVAQLCRLLHALSNENLVWRVKVRERWSVAGRPALHWRRYFRYKTLLHAPGALTWHKVERNNALAVAPRCAHTGCVVDGRIYYIGGQDQLDRRLGEIHCYNPETDEWKRCDVKHVPNFARHQAAAVGDRIFTFGGYDLQKFYDLAMFVPATNTWSYPTVSGDRPQPRSNHASAVLGSRFYIFGGSVGDNVNRYETVNDFYCCDLETMHWTRLEPRNMPSRRVGHRMCALHGKVYLFGGGVWSQDQGWMLQYNETWIYDPETNEWTEVKADARPTVCTYSYMFTFGTHIAVYGGASITTSSVEKDLWLFDTITHTWDKMELAGSEEPTSRSMGSSDLVGNSVYFWGGYSGGVLSAGQDFCRLDLSPDIRLEEEPLFLLP